LEGNEKWIVACAIDDIETEDVLGVECAGRSLAIYRSPEDSFYATGALCTHEHALLSDGYVFGDTIECPKHNGRFNYKTGDPTRAPACERLKTYRVKLEDGQVFVQIG
jgi:3-phenylpropionate/trans-cinnamate dioxygenase ferredoxin subunit